MGRSVAAGLGWWARRLREMRARELPHRLREQVRRRRRWRPPEAPAGPLPRWPVRVVLDPTARDLVARGVRQVLVDGFPLLGTRIAPERRTRWSEDPLTGHVWPDRWCFDIDLRAEVSGEGEPRILDPKPAWELQRLGHLQLLALGGEEAAGAAREDLVSWMAHAPPFRGIGWASGLEVASRVVSLLRVADGLRGLDPARPDPMARALRSAMLAHGLYLERYPSLYSSANNHRIAEASALVLLGGTLDVPEAPGWLASGLAALEDAVPGVILDDGGAGEMSVAYLAYTVEWLLVARTVGPLPAEVERRLALATGFLGALLDGAGHHPRIGDDDDGVVLRQAFPEDRYVCSVTGAAGALLGRPDLVPPAWRPDLRARILGAPEVRGALRSRGRCFPSGGLTVLTSRRVQVVVDHGPLGWPALAAHGHADALAVWAHADGRPLLVGQGTYRYLGEPGWRRWLRGTGAHCALVLDGADQSEPHDDAFLWRTRARATLEGVELAPTGGRVVASHDGYQRRGVLHRREVILRGDELAVSDTLEGVGAHVVALAWHFAPDLTLREEGGGAWVVIRAGQVVATLVLDPILGPGEVVRQDPVRAPGPGAHSPRYGELQPATTLWSEARVTLPLRHRAVLSLR